MSASDKKKLRKEAAAAKLTEKQEAERKEAKKLKTYSTIFGVVIAVMLVFAIIFAVTQTVNNSGILERNTVAVTVGDQEISSAEMNIYYIDAVNSFYNQYGAYAAMFGLDVTKPLDQQVLNEETGETWADDFMNSAKQNLKSAYALSALAEAEGMTLSEDEAATIESTIGTLGMYAMIYGYPDTDAYLKAMYGNGCSEKLYREYLERNTLADAYYAAYGESLTYDDAALRAAEAENFSKYSSYSYTFYTLNVNKFLTGGTTAEDGTVTYSEEEKAAAVAAAEEAAKALTANAIVTVEDLDAAIAALPVNAETAGAASTSYTDYLYTNINATIRDWLSDSDRKDGDRTYIPSTTTSTDENGNEVTTTNSYIVVYFHGSNDNTFALANVRHILLNYEGGVTDENGITVYSEDEKMAAEAKGVDLLAQFETNGATAEAFAALANEHSTDPGSNTVGGLYEDIYPGQMVPAFNDWCFAEGRKAGDTGVIHADYGCHVMYYDGDSETTYRDFMITNDLKSADMQEWYTALLESVTVTDKNLKRIQTDLVLGG